MSNLQHVVDHSSSIPTSLSSTYSSSRAPPSNIHPDAAQHTEAALKELTALILLHGVSLEKKAQLDETVRKNASANTIDPSAQRIEANHRHDFETTTHNLTCRIPSIQNRIRNATTEICQTYITPLIQTARAAKISEIKSSILECKSHLNTIDKTRKEVSHHLLSLSSHQNNLPPPFDVTKIISEALEPLHLLTESLDIHADEINSSVDDIETKLETALLQPVEPITCTLGICQKRLNTLEARDEQASSSEPAEQPPNSGPPSDSLSALLQRLNNIRVSLNEGQRSLDEGERVGSIDADNRISELNNRSQNLLKNSWETLLKSYTSGGDLNNQSFSDLLEATLRDEVDKCLKTVVEEEKASAVDSFDRIWWDEVVQRYEEGFVPDVEALYAEYEAAGRELIEGSEPGVEGDGVVGENGSRREGDQGGKVPLEGSEGEGVDRQELEEGEVEEDEEEEEEELASGSVRVMSSSTGANGRVGHQKRSSETMGSSSSIAHKRVRN